MDDPRPLTRVGHILYDAARFCGRGVFDEMMETVQSNDELLGLALGIRLDAQGIDVLRMCSVALLSPDARVWPLKTVRVVARARGAMSLVMRPSFAAHALEAADHDEPLRELPAKHLDYRGVAPRRIERETSC